jgi:hypothetical protein
MPACFSNDRVRLGQFESSICYSILRVATRVKQVGPAGKCEYCPLCNRKHILRLQQLPTKKSCCSASGCERGVYAELTWALFITCPAGVVGRVEFLLPSSPFTLPAASLGVLAPTLPSSIHRSPLAYSSIGKASRAYSSMPRYPSQILRPSPGYSRSGPK